jgi:hypothetical protein
MFLVLGKNLGTPGAPSGSPRLPQGATFAVRPFHLALKEQVPHNL